MLDFIRKMVSDSNEVSSKRVIALIATLLLVVVVIAIIYGIKIQNEMIYSLITIISGNSAMTLKNTGNSGNGDSGNGNGEKNV